MRSTRAYVVSIGASVSLIAAAALMLLTVSTVVALEGWPGVGATETGPALIVGEEVLANAGERSARAPDPQPVVLRAARPAPAPERAPRTERREAPPTPRVGPRQASESTVREAPSTTSSTPALEPSTPKRPDPVAEPGPRPEAPPVAPRAGDGVRSLGDSVNNTVQSTGSGLQELAAPISPQAGQALKDITVLIGGLLQKTTGAVGGVLDGLTKPR